MPPSGIVVPPHRFELPDRSDAGHDGEVALSANLRRRDAARIAGHSDVARFQR
jgi:hypothetical protein